MTTDELTQLIAPGALAVTPSYIQIGDKYARTLFVGSYPRYLNTSWLSPIINLDRVLDIALFIQSQPTGDVLKQLRDQLARLQAQIMEEQSAGKVRNPQLETAVSDIEALRDSLQQGTERFFKLGLYLTLYGNSVRELDDLEKSVAGVLEGQLVITKQATFRMVEGFLTTAPFCADRLLALSPMNTEPLASTFPFVSSDLTSNSGILYGLNTSNNSLVLFDRFSLENANMVVFAKSGAGKSYAIKLEILRSLMFDTQVIVIDPEDEYKYLSDTVGGTNVKISINSDQHINPFDLPTPKDEESWSDVFTSHVLGLSGLMRLLMGGEVTPEEESILDQAITQTYAIKDIVPDQDFSSLPPPVLSDLQSVLEGMAGAERLATRLQKFTTGSFAGFLNNPTNVPLDNQLIVFGIRDLEDELRPIAMYTVLSYVWTQIRRERKRRMLVVDEAWWVMKFPVGADFLFNIAKRGRKYYCGLTTISQDIPDFMNTAQGKAIVTNSSLQLLLKQSPAAIEVIQQTFNLTDSEKYYLLEARVGFGLFFLGSNHVGIRILASYAEDQIITSDPRQLMEIEKAKQEWAKVGQTS
ncbi:MAG TPA: ATP-binding protein [Candidatus Paceibacterota bacterium]|nr:ATP-binding protein [Candidatus Paceibacterota bacterium]